VIEAASFKFLLLRPENGMNAIAEQNIAHFKFLSQHFHKSLAQVSDTSELKGNKALDRFARLAGFSEFNQAFYEIGRKTKRLSDFPLDMKKAYAIYAGLYEPNHMSKASELYYDLFFFSHHNQQSIKFTTDTLKKLHCFSWIPRNPKSELTSIYDNFAVALFDFTNRIDSIELIPIGRSQLVGVILMLGYFHDKQLIPGFGFQDVLDLLEPETFCNSLRLYETILAPQFNLNDIVTHCYEKCLTYMTQQQLEDNYNQFAEYLSLFVKIPLNKNKVHHLNLIDRAILKSIHLGHFDERVLRSHGYQKLINAGYFDDHNLNDFIDGPRKLSARITDSGKEWLV
jgi:hypothetical protein